MTRILFVCTGNTCRSPLAEGIARKILVDRLRNDVDVSSAGIDAWDGGAATDEALLVGIERGLDIGSHRSRKLTREIVRDSDLILTMSPQHLTAARRLGGEEKTHLLSQYASAGESDRMIRDPFGGDLEAYRSTADDLQGQVQLAIDRFLSESKPE
ncbi:MAG: low molecular weight protein arginine phosphatase [Gemmatimonadaceae bacterium]|nr:low molecular weight protein arginine phosphatase [Gemmatimonadaceae bacterium]